MILSLERKKLKYTGISAAFLGGALLAASIPVLNTYFRKDMFIYQHLPSLEILLNANGQMLSMMNLFLCLIGACIIFHTEFSGNGMKKMSTLPVSPLKLFAAKSFLLTFWALIALIIESSSLYFCQIHWFPKEDAVFSGIISYTASSLLFLLPALILMLMVASCCSNMWISLGTGVICIFVATLMPVKDSVLSYFLLVLPFQNLYSENFTFLLSAALIQLAFLGCAEIIIIKLRRILL